MVDTGRLEVAEQLLQAGSYETAVQELCGLESVCARAKAGQLFPALRQLLRLQSLPASQTALTDSSRQRLDHYIRWIRRDVYSIMKDPWVKQRVGAEQGPTQDICGVCRLSGLHSHPALPQALQQLHRVCCYYRLGALHDT